ncbi:MAG TPA: hypothetical protein VFW39_10630 [Sphingomicrobium sp.]|nr:hypothetical protein [Sphingomicrobium sp.]
MRKLLIGSAAVLGAALAASPASAQYYGYGYSPYSSYSYSPYSYGYSYPSYSYSPYSYGYSNYSNYSYSPYSYGYSSYGYPAYSTRSYYRTRAYGCRVRRHHRDGIVYYTRDC